MKHVSCFIGSSNLVIKPCNAFVEMSLHVVDNSICVCVCYPIPCLSVENVSVTTTVPPTPTTQPITSHPATPTLLTHSFAPDPKGNAHTPYYSASTLHLSPRPSLLSFGVFHSPTHLMTLRWPTPTHTCTHPSFCCNLPLPCIYMSVRACRHLDVHRAQPPTLSLFLITGCLMLPTHTLLSQHLCTCVCVRMVWGGSLGAWWVLLMNLR